MDFFFEISPSHISLSWNILLFSIGLIFISSYFGVQQRNISASVSWSKESFLLSGFHGLKHFRSMINVQEAGKIDHSALISSAKGLRKLEAGCFKAFFVPKRKHFQLIAKMIVNLCVWTHCSLSVSIDCSWFPNFSSLILQAVLISCHVFNLSIFLCLSLSN